MENDKNFEIKNKLNAELALLMSDLSANTSSIGDWKVVKIYEARMLGNPDPYNFDELTTARNNARTRINEILEELTKLND